MVLGGATLADDGWAQMGAIKGNVTWDIKGQWEERTGQAAHLHIEGYNVLVKSKCADVRVTWPWISVLPLWSCTAA